LEKQLVCLPLRLLARIKRLKTKASVRERELESREQADQKERRAKKHEPIYVVLRIPDCNAIAVKSEPKKR
jgi:hypothetical protein